MKEDILEKVNMSAMVLLNANTAKQLEVAVVETLRNIIAADYGQFYLFTKDRYKKMYSSHPAIKKTTVLKPNSFRQYLQSDNVIVLKKENLKAGQIEGIPNEIKTIVLIPFFHKNISLGFLILFRKAKSPLTKEENESLRLLNKTAILAITKYRLQEESKNALEMRDHFISLASHELRTPMTSLHGYIQLLHARMSNLDTAEARWVNELFIESNRLTSLVKELLDVNRIKQGQFDFVFNEIYMRDVIKKALENTMDMSRGHQIIFNNKIIQTPIRIVGDFDKLVQMVSGLLSNSLKFSEANTKIHISLRASQGLLSLTIKDEGRGISKKDLAAIFEGFYKTAHSSTIQGMGVGLMLAKHIIDNHRGKIRISSKEHKGTKVEVMLPTIK